MSKAIRIVMVRCDGHAYTFGPLMAKCDVIVEASRLAYKRGKKVHLENVLRRS